MPGLVRMLSRVASCRPSSISSSCFTYKHVTILGTSSQWRRFEHTEPKSDDRAINASSPKAHTKKRTTRFTTNLFQERTEKIIKKDITNLFTKRQFTIIDNAPGKTTKDQILKRIANTYNHLLGFNRGLVVLTTPQYASWLEDDQFMSQLVSRAVTTRKMHETQKKFEVSVLAAVVDGLSPTFAEISCANNKTPAEGFSILEGYADRILPGLWDSSHDLEDNSNTTQSCITFTYENESFPIIEFAHIRDAVNAFHTLKNDEKYKGLKANFRKPWYEHAPSSKWGRESQQAGRIEDDQNDKRGIRLIGLPTQKSITHRDIAYLVRGGLIEQINYVPGNDYCMVRFVHCQDAVSFIQWSKLHPEELNINGKSVSAYLARSSELEPIVAHALKINASRGLRITAMPKDWSIDRLVKEMSQFGEISEETTGLKNVPGGLNDLSVTMPLANTLFTNGRYSTMLATKWAVTSGTEAVKTHFIEKKHQVVPIGISSTRNLPNVIESCRALPLTQPRRIVSGLGNIVRELKFDAGHNGPASQELESSVNAYMEAVSATMQPKAKGLQSNGTIRVWALVVPQHLQEEFLDSAPEELESEALFREAASYNQNSEAPGHDVVVAGKPIGHWIARGAKFCRVLSGGGGWGAKQGLLSLDPQISYEDTTEARFDYSLGTSAEEQDSALGKVAQPGSLIQFFIASPVTITKPNYFWLPRSIFSQTNTFGTVPSTIDRMPTTENMPSKTEEWVLPKIKFGHFGAVSESGLFLKYRLRQDDESQQDNNTDDLAGDLKPGYVYSKLDLPFTYVAQESLSNFTIPTKPSEASRKFLEGKSAALRLTRARPEELGASSSFPVDLNDYRDAPQPVVQESATPES